MLERGPRDDEVERAVGGGDAVLERLLEAQPRRQLLRDAVLASRVDERALVHGTEIEADRGLGSGELVQTERDDAVAGAEIGDPLPGQVEVVTREEVDDLLRRGVVVVVEPRDVDGTFHRAQTNRRHTPGSDQQRPRGPATGRPR